MTVLDKIKAFFKRPKPKAKGTEKKLAETAEKKEGKRGDSERGEKRGSQLISKVTNF